MTRQGESAYTWRVETGLLKALETVAHAEGTSVKTVLTKAATAYIQSSSPRVIESLNDSHSQSVRNVTHYAERGIESL